MHRIVQISDLHIPEDDKPRHSVPIRKHFEKLIEEVSLIKFDTLIVSGDLAWQVGDVRIYSYIKELLKPISQPILYMPGNHDDLALMRKIFPMHGTGKNDEFFTEFLGNTEAIFLDSSTNEISAKQLKWFEAEMKKQSEQLFVFCHHPVLHCNVTYMDNNHFLKNRDELKQLLFAQSKPVHFFSGHYHTEKIVVENNVTQYLCPSNYYTIDNDSGVFQIEAIETGFRIIDIENERIISRVKHFCL